MNTIQIPNNKLIKKFARQMFKGHWFEAFLVVAISSIITSVPMELINLFAPTSNLLAFIGEIYMLLMFGPLNLGVAFYFLSTFRGEKLAFNALSKGFDNFSKAVLLYVISTLKIMLWSFLFVFPGVLAAIRYSQAFFIMADHPEKGANQCIEESKALMKIYWGRYLLLVLGYAGWFLLAGLPTAIITQSTIDVSLFANYSFQNISELLFDIARNPWFFVSDLTKILFDVYFYMGTVCFFDIITGNLVFDGNPQEQLTDR